MWQLWFSSSLILFGVTIQIVVFQRADQMWQSVLGAVVAMGLYELALWLNK